jgi:hypothetical protein
VLRLQNAADLALLDACRALVDTNLDAYFDILHKRNINPQTQPFAFREVCHRAPRRYDLQLGDVAHAPLPPEYTAALGDAVWQPLLSRCLGRDMRHSFDGVVVAEPGAAPQKPHMDGGHLFHATHGFSLDLPVHMVNVFLPLVDLPLEMGPTEFWPQSHLAHNVMQIEDMESIALEAQRGDAIIFDYRTFHRGLPNLSSDRRRPVMYQTYSRAWCLDSHNFPDSVSLLEPDADNVGEAGAGAVESYNPNTGFRAARV